MTPTRYKICDTYFWVIPGESVHINSFTSLTNLLISLGLEHRYLPLRKSTKTELMLPADSACLASGLLVAGRACR